MCAVLGYCHAVPYALCVVLVIAFMPSLNSFGCIKYCVCVCVCVGGYVFVCVCVCVMRLFGYKRLRNTSLYLCWPRNLYYAAVFVNSIRVHLPVFPVFCVTFLIFHLRHCPCNLDTVCRRSDLVISHLRQQSFASCISSEMCVCVYIYTGLLRNLCVYTRGSSET